MEYNPEHVLLEVSPTEFCRAYSQENAHSMSALTTEAVELY